MLFSKRPYTRLLYPFFLKCLMALLISENSSLPNVCGVTCAALFAAQHKSGLVCPIHANSVRSERKYSNDASGGTRCSCFVYDSWPIENSQGPMVVPVVPKNSKLSHTRGFESNRRRFFSFSASIFHSQREIHHQRSFPQVLILINPFYVQRWVSE